MNDVLFILVLVAGGLFMIGYPVGVTVACAAAIGQLVGRGEPDRRWNGRVAAWASATMIGAAFYAAPLAAFVVSVPALIVLRGMQAAKPIQRLAELPRARVAT